MYCIIHIYVYIQAIVTAINVPMGLAKKLNSLWELLDQVSQVGNINCKSDLQVAVRYKSIFF